MGRTRRRFAHSTLDTPHLGRRGSLRSPLRCEQKLVAREGIAPSTSVCRTDMILFHHRASQTMACWMAGLLDSWIGGVSDYWSDGSMDHGIWTGGLAIN